MPPLSPSPINPALVQLVDGEPHAILLEKIAAGDQVALGDLYFRASESLHNVASFVLSDSLEAEDVVQEVFILIWSRAALFDVTRGTALAWLASVTRRRAIDRWRTRTRHIAISNTFLAEHAEGLYESSEATAELRMRDEDDCRVVRCAVAALPKPMSEVIELIFFRGLSHTEAAERLGEPLGTVKARARRALLRLKTLLRRVGFENVDRMDDKSPASGRNDETTHEEAPIGCG